jgi:hypothetical protein
MDIQATEFSVGPSGENAIDGVLIGADKIRTGSDTNIETSEMGDLPFLRNVFHFTQYVRVDVRPVEEDPNHRFRHMISFRHSKISGTGADSAIQVTAKLGEFMEARFSQAF